MIRIPEEELDYTVQGHYFHQGRPFTGIAYLLDDTGRLEGEQEFRDGYQWGVGRGWFTSGQMEYEEHLSQGLAHGLRREWDEEGRLAAEEMYELGTRLWGNRWDADGNLIEQFRLSEADPAFEMLETYRKAYKKAGTYEPLPPLPE